MELKNTTYPKLDALRAGLIGEAFAPDDEGYDAGRSAWNLNAHQSPELVMMAENTSDIAAAVRFAREGGLGVAVMATGHGVGVPCDGGVLINTSRMKGVEINPERRTARVEPGAKWADVIPESQKHGLAGLLGSTSDVSVTGYTSGGGFAWLGRKYGFNADSVVEAEVVTADGEIVRVSPEENADLFWGIRGGGGNFGIITSLEFSLYPLTHVYGGNIYYPIEKAPEVLEHYAAWVETLPDEMTSAVVFLNFPPIPEIPPFLHGQSIAVRGAYSGERPEDGEEIMRSWREGFEPKADDMGVIPYAEMDAISMDPIDPLAFEIHVERLDELTPEAISTLVELAGADSGMPSEVLEIRHLGGALTREGVHPSAISHRDSRFIMAVIADTPTPEISKRCRAYHARVAVTMRPHATGATYVNFLDLDEATENRVRAAYSPEDYERLVALKNEYDPGNLFRFNRNIPPTPKAG